jgi:hypothetical protein
MQFLLVALIFVFSALPCSLCHWVKGSDIKLTGDLHLANEGLTVDPATTTFYLNSKHILYKASLHKDGKKSKLKEVLKNDKAIPGELTALGYNHIGDMAFDADRKTLYGGCEYSTESPGVIVCYNATDLSFLGYTKTPEQKGAPWVAFQNNILYSGHWSDQHKIYRYDVLNNMAALPPLITKEGATDAELLPIEIQGSSFWSQDPSAIYLASNGGCSVHRVELPVNSTSTVLGAVTLAAKDKCKGISHFEEMEGLTFLENNMYLYGNFEGLEKNIHGFSWEK